jgi:hypothetical protein
MRIALDPYMYRTLSLGKMVDKKANSAANDHHITL